MRLHQINISKIKIIKTSCLNKFYVMLCLSLHLNVSMVAHCMLGRLFGSHLPPQIAEKCPPAFHLLLLFAVLPPHPPTSHFIFVLQLKGHAHVQNTCLFVLEQNVCRLAACPCRVQTDRIHNSGARLQPGTSLSLHFNTHIYNVYGIMQNNNTVNVCPHYYWWCLRA